MIIMLESNNKNNVLDAENNNGPRFTTILAARGEDGRPSDLEFLLRSHCRNPIRVVERLGTQAAHLLLPKVAGTTRSLAIRLIEDVNTESEQQLMTIFCQNFQLCLILFVLPFPTQKAQLDDPNSLFHFAQRLARKDQQESKKSHGDHMVRVSMVSNADGALASLLCLVEGMEKRDARRTYFVRQSQRYFSPPTNGSIPETCRPAASAHIAEALRVWADRMELTPGEINVVMSVMGTMQAIVTATPQQLQELPVEPRTKRALLIFFHGNKATTAHSLLSVQCAGMQQALTMLPGPFAARASGPMYGTIGGVPPGHNWRGPPAVHTNNSVMAMPPPPRGTVAVNQPFFPPSRGSGYPQQQKNAMRGSSSASTNDLALPRYHTGMRFPQPPPAMHVQHLSQPTQNRQQQFQPNHHPQQHHGSLFRPPPPHNPYSRY